MRVKNIFYCLPFFLFCLSPLLMKGQGWERVFSGSIQAGGHQVFIENDSTYLVSARVDLIPRLMRVNSDGYELSAINYPDSIFSTFIIETPDGNLVSGTNASTPPLSSHDISLTKMDKEGNIIWNYIYGSPDYNQRVTTLVQDANGDYVFAGGFGNPAPTLGYVAKVNEAGNELWSTILPGSEEIFTYRMMATNDGGYFVIGSLYWGSPDDPFLMAKLDQSGNVLWNRNDYLGLQVIAVTATANNGIVILGNDLNGIQLIEIDQNGDEVWSQEWPSLGSASAIISTNDGGFAFLYNKADNFSNYEIILVKTDNQGNEEWQQVYSAFPGFNLGRDLKQTPDQGFLITGTAGGESNEPEYTELYLIKTDANGNTLLNNVSGYVQYDLNENCENDTGEIALEDWIIKAEGEERTYYAIADSAGFYDMRIDTGNYEVSVQLPNDYWEACFEMLPLQLNQIGDSAQIDFPIQSIEACPLMEVNTSSYPFRLCDQTLFTVQYCNQGTLAADDVVVEITFDDSLQVLSATAPIINQIGDTYWFDIGSVDFLECSNFSVNLMVGCDIGLFGQTLCTEAHIYPDTTCLPISPEWSGASIELSVRCEGDSVKMIIQNIGTGNMESSLNYIVVEDDVIMLNEPYQLDSGDSLVIPRLANGNFYRIQSPQVPFHPGLSMPSAQLEACGVNNMGEISTGFANQYPMNDADFFVDILCKEVIAAYDPNQKEAMPLGYQDAHYIAPNTRIDYTIQFQNTGTDTAKKVVIQDILSSYLNPATFRQGAASHPYEVEMSEDGVLLFTFSPIMLPDSNINEPASHGFVQFSIEQKADLPTGAIINNTASIYFDFNPPIVTNTTYHTIGRQYILVDVEKLPNVQLSLKVYPNPFQDYAIFEVLGAFSHQQPPLQFRLYDVSGRLIRQDVFNDGRYRFEQANLQEGIYFYTVSSDEILLNRGKVICVR